MLRHAYMEYKNYKGHNRRCKIFHLIFTNELWNDAIVNEIGLLSALF